jgi:hypothetical protein
MKPQQTSITAYHQEKKHNASKKAQILDFIKIFGSATDHDLIHASGWPRNVVSARRRELVIEGVVVEAGLVFDAETRKTVMSWRIKP